MYISTLVIVYIIFISGFAELKLRICVFGQIVWLVLLMEILWAFVTTSLKRLVFISSRVQRERSGLLTTPFGQGLRKFSFVLLPVRYCLGFLGFFFKQI